MKTYRDLVVWQKAYEFTLELYTATKKFPKDEQYGLTSQLRRATISITSNIAEGFGRNSYREKDQFYAVAHGSLYEVENQVVIAHGVGYMSDDEQERLITKLEEVSRLLQGLRKANKLKGADSSSV